LDENVVINYVRCTVTGTKMLKESNIACQGRVELSTSRKCPLISSASIYICWNPSH